MVWIVLYSPTGLSSRREQTLKQIYSSQKFGDQRVESLARLSNAPWQVSRRPS